MQVGKEEVLQKFREWAGSPRERAKAGSFSLEEDVDSLQSLMQKIGLEAESLPEIYAEFKQPEEKVADGSYYSPHDEIDFLVKISLFYLLSQKLPSFPTPALEALCFKDLGSEFGQISAMQGRLIIEVLSRDLRMVDPSCGVGDFLVQYTRKISDWISKFCSAAELGDLFRRFLIGGISGVDSDPVAVVITRIRLRYLCKKVLRLESNSLEFELIKKLMNLSIAWGNALGTDVSQGILVSADDWAKKRGTKKDYEALCKVASQTMHYKKDPSNTSQILTQVQEFQEKQNTFLQKLIPELAPETQRTSPIFTWDANFIHILKDGGFDIVIGNPPYIRQEDIASSLETHDRPWRSRKMGQQGRRENRKYKTDLLLSLCLLAHLNPGVLSSKADLFAYFFLLAKYICKKGGFCGYITPNAWLDVQYGFDLQKFLTHYTILLGLYERKFARAFSAAAINTIITLFIPNPLEIQGETFQSLEILSLGTDYRKYINDGLGGRANPQKSLKFQNITMHSESLPDLGCRREISLEDLYLLGIDKRDGTYAGFKWGSLLFRAPDFFFELRGLLAKHLIPFLEVFDLNFGLKTGKNAFFIVPNKNMQLIREKRLSYFDGPDLKRVPVPAGILKPIVVSSRKLSSYNIDERASDKFLLQIPDEFPPQLAPYINWGRRKRYHLAPSCQAHHPHWFNLPEQRSPDFIFFRFMDQRMWVPVNRGQLLFSDNFFVGYAKDPSYVKPCAAYFNSTLHLFFSEIWGRTGLGEGLLTFYGPDYRFLEILDPRNLDHATIDELDKRFLKLAEQPVQSILDDLQNPARIALDSLIIETILHLPKAYLSQLYEAFRALVTQRLGRAKRKY